MDVTKNKLCFNLNFWRDETCTYCNEAFRILNRRDLKENEYIVVSPDYNSGKYLTHHHIRIEKKED